FWLCVDYCTCRETNPNENIQYSQTCRWRPRPPAIGHENCVGFGSRCGCFGAADLSRRRFGRRGLSSDTSGHKDSVHLLINNGKLLADSQVTQFAAGLAAEHDRAVFGEVEFLFREKMLGSESPGIGVDGLDRAGKGRTKLLDSLGDFCVSR